MYLVDTSVWIPFLSDSKSDSARLLTKLLDDNAALCINALVEMEILPGIRSEKAKSEVQRYLADFQYFPDFSHEYFLLAAEIYRRCRKKGLTVRKSVDCLIAANGLKDKLAIVHHDRDFEKIKMAYPKLVTVTV